MVREKLSLEALWGAYGSERFRGVLKAQRFFTEELGVPLPLSAAVELIKNLTPREEKEN